MSTARTAPDGDDFLDLIFESLHRDAFVMEALNYEQPALPDRDSFREMYDTLHEQISKLLRGKVFSACFIKLDPKPADQEFSTLLGCSQQEPLWDIDLKPDAFVSAAILNTEALSEAYRRAKFAKDAVVVIAPYIVRKNETVGGVKDKTLYQQLQCFHELRKTQQLTSFLRTQPFIVGEGSDVVIDSNTYYCSFLLIVSEDPDIRMHRQTIEALHINFQLAWGVPALSKANAEMQARRAIEKQEQAELKRINQTLHAQSAIFDQIKEPAKQLADQIRKLEVDAGQILRMLVPVHHTLFNDLQRGAIFFNEPGDSVDMGNKFSIRPAHQYGNGDSAKPIFISAVVARILDLNGLTERNLISRVHESFTFGSEDRPGYVRIVEALRKILGLQENQTLGIGDAKIMQARFEILRDICHRPFKSRESMDHAFDANLCYGFFDHDPGPRPRVPCRIKPPNRPDQFLQGCQSFLEPKGGWTEKAKGQLQVSYGAENARQYLELTFQGRDEDFELIQNPKRLWHLLMHTSRTEGSVNTSQSDLDGAKTQLWEWATSKLTNYASEATHIGNLLGAVVLIFGNLASSVAEPLDEDGIVTLKTNSTGTQVSVTASMSQRRIKIVC